MTQFKDKSGQRDNVSLGLFGYPVLMAADILAYNPARVPVGDDQRQHLELTRTIAKRFNSRFGDVFVVPEAEIPPVGARIMDLRRPMSKMSKSSASDAGTIFLLDKPEAIRRKFSQAVTDLHTEVKYDPSQQPGISNLLSILGAAIGKAPESLASEYSGSGYGDLKRMAADAVIELLRPVQRRYAELTQDRHEIERQLMLGAVKAREVSTHTLGEAQRAMGLLQASPS
jgi:tryptophanyl-tRNA synthetase